MGFISAFWEAEKVITVEPGIRAYLIPEITPRGVGTIRIVLFKEIIYLPSRHLPEYMIVVRYGYEWVTKILVFSHATLFKKSQSGFTDSA